MYTCDTYQLTACRIALSFSYSIDLLIEDLLLIDLLVRILVAQSNAPRWKIDFQIRFSTYFRKICFFLYN